MINDREEEGRKGDLGLSQSLGLEHITLKQAISAASQNFIAHLPVSSRPISWHDLVEAAYNLRKEVGISQRSWAEACAVLGRAGAAITVLLTEKATQRENYPVLKPAGYFNAMVNRGRRGELNLHKSIFGILNAE